VGKEKKKRPSTDSTNPVNYRGKKERDLLSLAFPIGPMAVKIRRRWTTREAREKRVQGFKS